MAGLAIAYYNDGRRREGISSVYVQVTIDDQPQLECTEVLPGVRAPTTAGLHAHAVTWYITRGGGRAAKPDHQGWSLWLGGACHRRL